VTRDGFARRGGRGRALVPATEARAAFDVVGLGENSLDLVCTVTGELREGAKLPMDDLTRRPGGQVATALLGCARLGLGTAFISSVGDDADADQVLEPLRSAGVDLASVRIVPATPTRRAIVIVDAESGERTVLWRRDPRLSLRSGQLKRDEILRGRVLHIDTGDPEAAEWAARVARDAGRPVVLDADGPWPGLERLLALVDFPVVSRAFAEELGGTGSIVAGLEALERFGARAAVATLGELGALAKVDGQLLRSPAFEIEARDTTGAGDAFHAGFIWGLLSGCDAAAALLAGNGVAALNCGALGAQGGLPDRAALEHYLRTREPGPWRAMDATTS